MGPEASASLPGWSGFEQFRAGDSGSSQVQALIQADHLAVGGSARGMNAKRGLAPSAETLGEAIPVFFADGRGDMQITVQR